MADKILKFKTRPLTNLHKNANKQHTKSQKNKPKWPLNISPDLPVVREMKSIVI